MDFNRDEKTQLIKEMDMENGLQTVKENLPSNMNGGIDSWRAMKEQAGMLVKSGFLPVAINTPEKAVAIAMTGKELGIGMMEAFRSINVIQGKPTISPQLMLALANRTKEVDDISIDSTDERCIVIVKRKGRKAHTEEFGVKQAKDMGLMLKDNYKKQAATMFKWRAIAANLRVTFPDVVLGLYTPEEMGADIVIGENESVEVIQPKIEAPKSIEVKKEPQEEYSEGHISKITEPQRKRFCLFWKASGKTPNEVKEKLSAVIGSESTADITTDVYEDLCTWAKGELNIKTAKEANSPWD